MMPDHKMDDKFLLSNSLMFVFAISFVPTTDLLTLMSIFGSGSRE